MIIGQLSSGRSRWAAAFLFLAAGLIGARGQVGPPSDVPTGTNTAAPADSTEPPAESAALSQADRKQKIDEMIERFGWQRDGVGAMGQWAAIDVPAGYRFTSGDGTRKVLQLFGNLVGTSEQGLIAPENLDWFVVFDFDPVGYVKDDEKDKLDAEKLLEQKRENSKLANEEKKKRGLPRLEIVGWTVAPHYDSETNNLEWGIRLRADDGSENVNYNMKLLGRSGVMDATLVCGPEQLDSVLPEARRLITGYRFQPGQTYAEYRKGDKIAEYGLTALVVGGGAVLAAKAGLLGGLAKLVAKGGKLIIAGIVVAAATIGKFFKRLMGRGTTA